jgi:hypothetical protein
MPAKLPRHPPQSPALRPSAFDSSDSVVTDFVEASLAVKDGLDPFPLALLVGALQMDTKEAVSVRWRQIPTYGSSERLDRRGVQMDRRLDLGEKRQASSRNRTVSDLGG